MSESLFPLPAAGAASDHWHVADHYTGESRTYRPSERRNLRAWVRRHGGEPIVEIVECDGPCLDAEAGSTAGDGTGGRGD